MANWFHLKRSGEGHDDVCMDSANLVDHMPRKLHFVIEDLCISCLPNNPTGNSTLKNRYSSLSYLRAMSSNPLNKSLSHNQDS